MPIAKTEEIKSLLQISTTDTSYDSLIGVLIPKVQNLIITKINSFANPKVYIQNSTISFNKANQQILDSSSKFVESFFISGLDIFVRGSLYNDKSYSIKTTAAGALTLFEPLVADEAAREHILIQAINFPPDISIAAAEFIAQKTDKQRNTKSFTIGKYSETRITSTEIMDVFAQWRDIYGGV